MLPLIISFNCIIPFFFCFHLHFTDSFCLSKCGIFFADAPAEEEASETNTKAQVDGDGDMLLTDVPGQEGISSHTIMNDLSIASALG